MVKTDLLFLLITKERWGRPYQGDYRKTAWLNKWALEPEKKQPGFSLAIFWKKQAHIIQILLTTRIFNLNIVFGVGF